MLKTIVERTLVVVAALLMCAAALPAAELHPIVEAESGYFFGAISDGKWIKADEKRSKKDRSFTFPLPVAPDPTHAVKTRHGRAKVGA